MRSAGILLSASSFNSMNSKPYNLNPCHQVKESCYTVSESSSFVKISEAGINAAADLIIESNTNLGLTTGIEWDKCGWHFTDDGPLTCQYVFVMDALNFCFWPSPGLEYDTLAMSLKNVLDSDSSAFNADRLAEINEDTLASWFPTHQLPLLSERVLCLRELGQVLLEDFNGSAFNVVLASNKSAVQLVKIIVKHFSRFRDTAIYKGRLVYFYKRAQILVGDIWAAYGKQRDVAHPCNFSDIGSLTMFADYRVPQILRSMGILTYSPHLEVLIDSMEEIPWGGEFEVELRAQTVVAVDKLQTSLKQRGLDLLVLECDWLLWQKGEDLKDEILPHHRTLSIYY